MKLGVDCIGITMPFFCTDGKGKWLLHQRSEKCRDEHFAWDFGGGALDFGEELETAVLRELKEEYGCEGEILKQLPPYSLFREFDGVKTHWIPIPFIIKVDPEKVKNLEPEKHINLSWYTLDNLPSPIHSGVAVTLSKYKDIFEQYSKL